MCQVGFSLDFVHAYRQIPGLYKKCCVCRDAQMSPDICQDKGDGQRKRLKLPEFTLQSFKLKNQWGTFTH